MNIIRQHDEKDCGPACLAMIANNYGLKIPIQRIREITNSGRNGTTIYNMVEGAKKIRFLCEAKSGKLNDFIDEIKNNNIKLPVIVHLKNNHFVVIVRYVDDYFIIADPALGKKKIKKLEFEKVWSGFLITFEKNIDFQEINLTKNRYSEYIKVILFHWKALLTILLMSIFISIVGLLGTYLFQSVIDKYIHNIEFEEEGELHIDESDMNPLEMTVKFFTNDVSIEIIFITVIVLFFFQGGIQFLRSYILAWLSKKIDLSLIYKYYSHLQNVPISILNTRMTGEYISRFSDTSAIRNAISGVTVTLILDGFMMVFGGWLLYEQCSFLFRYSLILVIIYLIVVLSYKKYIATINGDVMEKNAEVQSYLKETIDGIETIKTNNATKKVKNIFFEKFNILIDKIFYGNILFSSEDAVITLVESVGTTMLIWHGVNLVLRGELSIGSLVTFYLLLSYFVSPVKNLVELQPAIQKAVVAVDRLNDILDMKCENIFDEDGKSLDIIQTLEYVNTRFTYDGETEILSGLSFKASKGEKIALIGKSGCGKSTAAKLLLGLYQTNKDILINGFPIEEYSLVKLREKITYINQETFLFADSILNNILLGIDNVSEEDVRNVCKLSGLIECINEMPLGINTILEENGMNLSSGQRQRIAIARALIRHPEIIIFDEATCNLDRETEKSIQKTIGMLTDVICIVISHKVEMVRDCDYVYLLNEGRIAEYGTYEELSSACGLFLKLFGKE